MRFERFYAGVLLIFGFGRDVLPFLAGFSSLLWLRAFMVVLAGLANFLAEKELFD